MRHKVAGYKLGRNTSHRRSLLRNLVTSVIVDAAGCVGHGSRLWALRSRGEKGGLQPTLRTVRSSRIGRLAVTPGTTSGRKGAGSPKLQSVGVLRNAGAAWRETHLGERGERSSGLAKAQGGGTHLGLRANAFPFAGGCGTGDLSGGSSRVRARRIARCAQKSERGSAPRRSARMTRRCAVRFEEGPHLLKNCVNLRSGLAGPGTRASSGACRARLVSPFRPREGAE